MGTQEHPTLVLLLHSSDPTWRIGVSKLELVFISQIPLPILESSYGSIPAPSLFYIYLSDTGQLRALFLFVSSLTIKLSDPQTDLWNSASDFLQKHLSQGQWEKFTDASQAWIRYFDNRNWLFFMKEKIPLTTKSNNCFRLMNYNSIRKFP